MTRQAILEMVYEELKNHDDPEAAATCIVGQLQVAFPSVADPHEQFLKRVNADGAEELEIERAAKAELTPRT